MTYILFIAMGGVVILSVLLIAKLSYFEYENGEDTLGNQTEEYKDLTEQNRNRKIEIAASNFSRATRTDSD